MIVRDEYSNYKTVLLYVVYGMLLRDESSKYFSITPQKMLPTLPVQAGLLKSYKHYWQLP